MAEPVVRTHSVRSVVAAMDGADVLECRGCGERWEPGASVEVLNGLPCGTRGGDRG